MKVFIKNYTQLAKEAGITRQYLSAAKAGKHCMSKELLSRLEKITDIDAPTWVSPQRKKTLENKLVQFFAKEKLDEALYKDTGKNA